MGGTVLEVDLEVFNSAAQVTVVFLTFFMAMLITQGLTKVGFQTAAIKAKQKYDRFSDPRMLVYDRIVGNLLEWSPPFLGLFWLSMLATGGATTYMGWGYVACRVLYPLVALAGGIYRGGNRPIIFVSTAPAYACLVGMMVATARAVF